MRRATLVTPGDILVKIPRETTKTKDITGGLPRVAELFEARRPKEQAVISEIDGTVEYGGFVKGMRRVIVKGALGDEKEYLIPKGKHVNVHEGDWVIAGEPLMDGSVDPHDILDIMGPKELQKYLVDQVQQVYRLQGVSINDKHIEVIVRQMLRKVRIEDSGDTRFLIGEQVDKFAFIDENDNVSRMVKVEEPGDTEFLLGELVDSEGDRGSQRQGRVQGREAGGVQEDQYRSRQADTAGHNQGVSLDGQLHIGGILPGDHQGTHRGCDQRQRRPPPWS